MVPLMLQSATVIHRKQLFFFVHIDAGSTAPGMPYEVKYTDDYSNLCVHLIDCPMLSLICLKTLTCLKILLNFCIVTLFFKRLTYQKQVLHNEYDGQDAHF